MTTLVSPAQNSYVGALIHNVMVLGGRAFKK